MSPKEQGRHCASCGKTVTDFSKMNNDEILRYLAMQQGEVCGRLKKEQLQPPTSISVKLKHFLYALCIVFFPFLGFSQEKISNADSTSVNDINPSVIKASCKSVRITPKPEPTGVKGIIRNNKGYRIPFATLIIRKAGTQIASTTADTNGLYSINELEADFYEFEFAAPNYKTVILVQAEIKKGHVWDLDISLNKKRKRDKATHETRKAPYNSGGIFYLGGVTIQRREHFSPWKLPGHPALWYESRFHHE